MKTCYDDQIEETENLLKKLRRDRITELKRMRRAMPKKRSGRKPVDEDILELAKKLAERKPLTEVALQLNVSLRTLYNKGISRRALNEKNS